MLVRPKFLLWLVVAILLVVAIKLLNPNREYSSRSFWESATIESVYKIPDEALAAGNKNGGVLMWAAMATSDPEILSALVSRGADVNESDVIYKGTPLTGAAGYSSHPEIIDELIRLGAKIDKLVGNEEDALMIAAQYNKNGAIIERLLAHGADLTRVNAQGKTALDLAIENDNSEAERILRD